MTKTTDTRQLRLMVDGVLASYGIDNLELSIKLVEGVKRMVGSPTPAHTREQILSNLSVGSAKSAELLAIQEEISRRVSIRPVGMGWEDFINWVWKQGKDRGQTISDFLTWWLSDEWRASHPPFKPDGWYVQWPLAFRADAEPLKQYEPVKEVANAVPNPYSKPASLRS